MRGGGLEFFSGGFDANGIKHCLQSPDPAIQASAIKQIIANMTVGKDQSSHFADVARLINSANLSVKKMVYLYLMQNAKSQPEKAVMYAGSFVRDATHDSPVIRGIAVRTMASLQVPAMTPFANEVVIKGLHDADPYVRRNAAFGVLKLFQVSPEVLQESTGRLQDLVGLLADPFAAVVAAAVATICELVTLVARPEQLISSLVTNVNTLLNALSECTEWSQIYLLQGVSLFFTEQARHLTSTLADCETIADRVLTFLQSSNPAVVMATINVVTNFLLVFCGNSRSSLTALQQTELEKKYSTKIAPALVSMVTSTKYEIRYVALRNVRIIVQRYKECLVPHITSFFVKFDDPIYIKLEKIDIMLNLATRANAEIILAELVEYATEIDIELVRKAVRCVGVLCVKVPTVAPQCVERLIKLIESRVSYIVQEAAVVVQTILRQYPSTYEAIIVTLCKSLDVLDDPESKAAVVWVLGEYADRIDNVVDLINIFFDGFPDEPLVVQLAILTATVKIFFVSAINASVRQATLERGLGLATQSPHVDLRDRACFYWRLILADATAASKVINSERDRIVESGLFDRGLLNELLKDTGRLTSVLHHSLSVAFGDGRRAAVTYDESDEETDADATARNRAARGETAALNGNPALQIEFTAPVEGLTNFITSPQATRMLDFVSVLDGATAGAGLNVAMAWEASTPLPRLHTKFSLASSSNLPSARVVMMQLNLNCWGLGFAEEFSPIEIRTERPGEVALAACTGNQQRATEEIQVAVKAEPMGVLFFIAPPIPPSLMIAPAPHIEATDYAQQFTKLDVAWGMPPTRVVVTSEDIISQRNLRLLGITLVHRRDEAPLIGLHLHCQCVNGSTMFAEVTLDSYKVALANIKTADATLADFFGNYLLDVLRA